MLAFFAGLFLPHFGALLNYPPKGDDFFCSSAHFGDIPSGWHPSGFFSKMADDLFLLVLAHFGAPWVRNWRSLSHASGSHGPWLPGQHATALEDSQRNKHERIHMIHS